MVRYLSTWLKKLKKTDGSPNVIRLTLLIVFIIFVGSYIYLITQVSRLKGEVVALEGSLATTTRLFRADLDKLNASFQEALIREQHNATLLSERLKQEVKSVAGTVNTLERLSKTDPELLAKYSKVFFLNENYAPSRLTAIPDDYKYSTAKAVTVHSDIWAKLKQMIDDAKRDSVILYVSSGYRSFAEQKNLKSGYKITYGAGTANQFSAEQGYSEHQLGTAIDFTTIGVDGALDGFDKTKAYDWLRGNAHRYGFILSYPQNNQFYQFEPWHWRFVGVKLATDLYLANQYFYNWDQRKIDQYLANIFE
jgi:LAS superfamily LD-carboxypeptidase LdcB